MSSAKWKFVDAKSDYQRMGIPNHLWHTTNTNQDYRMCETYPSDLLVPKSATLPVIVGSSKFRSRGRFPTLCYYSKETQAAICRSSQPLSGFSARCLEDEQLLEAILKSNPGSQFMYVVDTRPKLNAMANRPAGKGYENEDNYANIRFQFMGIENIHVMRNSQQRLLEASEPQSLSMADFVLSLENSGWLKHIKAILQAGVFIAKAVAVEGVSVLVHCSDGWDRTSQVCSVASLLLDPFYRTLKGFMVLLEKDWVSFGYKFSHRCGHTQGDAKEVAPVIDQFLEVVWQLSEQFPCAFEYNERFLISLHHHIYTCQYGNFICNSQKERREQRIQEQTHSIWPYLWENRSEFMNPLYRPDRRPSQGVLWPNTAPHCFKFWRGLYNRFDKGVHPRQSAQDCLLAIREESQQLEREMKSHEQKIAKLEKERGTATYPKRRSLVSSSSGVWDPSDLELELDLHQMDQLRGAAGTRSSFPLVSFGQQVAPDGTLVTPSRDRDRDSITSSSKGSNLDLSTHGKQQGSGVASVDLACLLSGGGGEGIPSDNMIKSPDLLEAIFSVA
ncbi:myotubularin-related protein 7-like [Engraulis encrasicolus]|uniref:myotubularin-related protein 7-like n=1 Tax=Engraulis encrasicolus TaxID=184585 RepID=UPI002FD15580